MLQKGEAQAGSSSDVAMEREGQWATRGAYQRRWRANPENRAGERKKLSRARGMKRFRESLGDVLPAAQRVGRCAFCRHRTPKFRVQRLKPTETGFEAMELPYCGEC